MKKLTKLFSVLSLLVMMFIVTGCEKSTSWGISAMLNNQSKYPAYIWVGERTKPERSDLVDPGQFKMITLYIDGREGDGKAYFEDHLKLHASKDGVNQSMQDDKIMNYNYDATKNMYIRWKGNGFSVDY